MSLLNRVQAVRGTIDNTFSYIFNFTTPGFEKAVRLALIIEPQEIVT